MVQRKISPKTLQPVKQILSQTKREIKSLNLRKVKVSLNYNSGKTAFYSKLRALFPPCSKQFQYNLNSTTRRFTPRYHQNTKACVILLPHLTHKKLRIQSHQHDLHTDSRSTDKFKVLCVLEGFQTSSRSYLLCCH